MRRRLAVPGALLLTVACTARAPALVVPSPALALTQERPAVPPVPREGPFEAAASREVEVVVSAGAKTVALRAFCRVGVWTTLERLRPVPFVTRETWGRLGERRPRRLTRVTDQAIGGVIVRVRPVAGGALDFRAEIAQVTLGPERTVDFYHGQRVTLPDPRRHGFRFAGRAPPGWHGLVARWGDVAVHLGPDEGEPGDGRWLQAGAERVFLAGAPASAEAFRDTWRVARPIHTVADGVERKDFRLQRQRRAAGCAVDAGGEVVRLGAPFVPGTAP